MERANRLRHDANFKKTKALPNGAATVNADALDVGLVGDRGAREAECELLISAPALTTTELPDTKTMTYDVQASSSPTFASGNVDLGKAVITQTGAGGAGAAAATARFRLPSTCPRYVRVNATNSGAGDASGKSLTEEILF